MSLEIDRSSGSSSDDETSQKANSDHEQDGEIEHTFNAAYFDSVKPDYQFVCPGPANWALVRAQWTANSTYPTSQGPVAAGAVQTTAPTPSLHLDDDFHTVDVEQVLVCLHRMERFPTPVALANMVEVLNVLWEEDGVG